MSKTKKYLIKFTGNSLGGYIGCFGTKEIEAPNEIEARKIFWNDQDIKMLMSCRIDSITEIEQ